MTRLKSILAVVLAVLWTAIGAHCQIETLPGMGSLRCDTQEQQSSASDSHCGDSHCIAIEQGHYQASQQAPLKAMPPVVFLFIVPVCELATESSLISGWMETDATAPPRPWQFFSRAALPPRAPSIIS